MESFVLDLSMSGDCGVTNSQGIEPFSYFGYLFCLLGHRTLTYGFSDSGLFVSPDLNRTTPSLKGFNILLYKHSYRYTNSLIGYCMSALVLCLIFHHLVILIKQKEINPYYAIGLAPMNPYA